MIMAVSTPSGQAMGSGLLGCVSLTGEQSVRTVAGYSSWKVNRPPSRTNSSF
jgi:hypothetical protein